MNILVIGGIAAGMSVAAKAKRSGDNINVTVIERESYVSFGACGLPYYLGGQFDNENAMFARTPKQIEDMGINLLLETEALSVDFDKKIVAVKNLKDNSIDELTYDRLMIATGAVPTLPKISGVTGDNVYTIAKLSDVKKLKDTLSKPTNNKCKSVCVIGGGFTGVEVADQLAFQGIEVNLIEAQGSLLSHSFDFDISEKIADALSQAGINVRTNEKLEKLILEDNIVTSVKTDKSTYEVDAVVIDTGIRPNTSFITDTRLEKLENGAIVVDSYGRTSVADVFSAGDCATAPHRILGNRYLPNATNANKLGRIIGNNIAVSKEKLTAFGGTLGSCCIKVGDYEVGSTGVTQTQAIAAKLLVKSVMVEVPNHTHYYPNQCKINIKLIYEADTKIVLGAQVFGKSDAVLRLMPITAAIHAKLTTTELGFMDFAYSPPFATTWEAVNVAANAAK